MNSQLSLHQRQQIERLLQQGCSQAAIARAIGVHRSTIKRELDRNTTDGTYKAVEAQTQSRCRKMMAGTWAHLKKRFGKSSGTGPSIPHRSNRGRSYNYRKKNRRARFYFYRPDNRPYSLHPHILRSASYWSRKKWYDERYRLRDYDHEEELRQERPAEYWLLYRKTSRAWMKYMLFGYYDRRLAAAIRREKLQKIGINALKRELQALKAHKHDEIEAMNDKADNPLFFFCYWWLPNAQACPGNVKDRLQYGWPGS